PSSFRLHPLLKRLGWALFTLWGVSVVTFVLVFVVPQVRGIDPAQAIAGNRTDPETIANIRKSRHLDDPLAVQYYVFVRDILTNNLKSFRNEDRVVGAIARRFPATLALAIAGLTVWLVASIPLGLFTARYAGTWIDRAALFLGLIAISIPTFWLGRLLQYYLGYRGEIFSVGGGATWWNLPLPALTLGLGGAAYYARLLHSSVRGVLAQDYVRAARARGLGETTVLTKHALKNALIPLVTILGMDFASLLSGLIFTEKIFAWPGIGSLAIDSVLNADMPMIMGTVMFAALMVVVMNILVDIAYRLIDPRVRFE
ncbi:MAG: ABC transporter permease, partial [Armatimonadota bacterium]|nr:ABC transporter permease [Armatimonadota bacterium]